jgi:hypothetical protein
MGIGEQLHERGKIAVMLWPQNKMPMVGQQAIGRIKGDSHQIWR